MAVSNEDERIRAGRRQEDSLWHGDEQRLEIFAVNDDILPAHDPDERFRRQVAPEGRPGTVSLARVALIHRPTRPVTHIFFRCIPARLPLARLYP